MTNPSISVLMPAYNTEKYVGEAIESVLNQTFKDFEFIIIDDGSTDKTWEIIQEYAKKDNRIVALRNERNLGISMSRNRLVFRSKGKYIAWQDSDDISLPTRLEKQYQFMESHPEVGICGGGLQFFNISGSMGVREYATNDTSLRKVIFRYNPVAQPAAIIRKECFEYVGGYNPNEVASEDLRKLFEIGMMFEFANLQEVVIKYREHEHSITFRKLRLLEWNTIRMRFSYAQNPHYYFGLIDLLFNIAQLTTLFMIPIKLRVFIFDLIRNSK